MNALKVKVTESQIHYNLCFSVEVTLRSAITARNRRCTKVRGVAYPQSSRELPQITVLISMLPILFSKLKDKNVAQRKYRD